MNNKKGQAALEFLMTYGWAILAAIIVIGSLGSYFYFNQGGSTSIFVGAPFYGIAAAADGTTDVLSLEIENKGGEILTVNSVAVTGASSGLCTINNTQFSAGSGSKVITLSGCTMEPGNNLKGDIVVTYLRPGSELPLTSTGSISTPVA